MKKNTSDAALILLAIGFVLALIKMVYSFFDFSNVLDLIIFSCAGFVFAQKVPRQNLAPGLVLALPAFVLCLFFVLRLGYNSLLQGVGTGYAISLIAIPLATLVGIIIRQRFWKRKIV